MVYNKVVEFKVEKKVDVDYLPVGLRFQRGTKKRTQKWKEKKRKKTKEIKVEIII